MTTRKTGTNAYSNAPAPNVITDTTAPTPPGLSTYWKRQTAGTIGLERWSDLPGDDIWQVRHECYLESGSEAVAVDLDIFSIRSGADATNNFIARRQSTDKMRITANGGGFPWTSGGTLPHDGWYLWQAYGRTSTNEARLALCDIATGAVITGFDSGFITVAQGGVNPTGIRKGQVSNATGYTADVNWGRTEIRTGADAALAFIGPFNTAPVVPPIAAQNKSAGSAFSFTVLPTDDGSISSIVWSVLTAQSTASPTLTPSTTTISGDTVGGTTPAAGNLTVLQCVVTDNGGLSTTVTCELRALQAGDFTTLDLPGVGGAGYTIIGGSANAGTALSDASDSTGTESPDYGAVEIEQRWRLEPLTPRTAVDLTPRGLVTATGGTKKFRFYEGNTLRQEWTMEQDLAATNRLKSVSTGVISAIADWGNLWVAEAVQS